MKIFGFLSILVDVSYVVAVDDIYYIEMCTL